jgi:hypothetical protein
MPDRKTIHRLIDSLPEEALEKAEALLRASQTWNPPPPVTVSKLREDVKRGMTESHGVPYLSRSDFSASNSTWENGTLVAFRVSRIQGQVIEMEERFKISKDRTRLQYSQHVSGPMGQQEFFEAEFGFH